MREIKFIAEYNGVEYEVSTRHKPRSHRGAHNFKGRINISGYWLVMVENHPLANSRGYYPEHRLVMERKLGRFLGKDEVVHHIDKNKKNNEENNLQLMVNQSVHASLEDRGKRNPNGTIVAADPKFSEIKYRLFDIDRNETFIYTISKLINTTFRKGKFKYRGIFTWLKDKNGIEIYEGDIVKGNRTPDNFHDNAHLYRPPYFEYREVKFEITKNSISINLPTDITYAERNNPISWEVVGNIHEHKHLLENNSTQMFGQ